MSLYPESLEQISKVISILTEDLSFKVDELFNLKEIQKLAGTKEVLVQMLEVLDNEGVVKLNKVSNEGTIQLTDKTTVYSLTNVPLTITKKAMVELFNLTAENTTRVYKQSLYWVIVSDNEEFNGTFESRLKQIEFEDHKLLKYNISSATMLKKSMCKTIHYSVYMKETNDLKVGSPNGRKGSEAGGLSGSNNEKLSWRKKSDMSTNSGNGQLE